MERLLLYLSIIYVRAFSPNHITLQQNLITSIFEALNLSDRSVFNQTHISHLPHRSIKFSAIEEQCTRLGSVDRNPRIGCCLPNDARYLYNVMISRGKLVYFKEPVNSRKSLVSGVSSSSSVLNLKDSRKVSLPPIKSLQQQHSPPLFNMEVEIRYEEFPRASCKTVFNGTLHVIGRSTAHNVYHTIGDNFAPLVSQILLDAVLNPEFLLLPRMALIGFQPGSGADSRSQHGTPHLRLLRDLMSAGQVTVEQAEGMCFRRIAWGHGAHVLYYDTLVTLRRQVADFARAFVLNSYKITLPSAFQITNGHNSKTTTEYKERAKRDEEVNKFMLENKPLKIVIYSRGNSGKGRSMQGEEKIVDALQSHGALVYLCCNFAQTSLEDQLALAVHADVIMGLHGAALVHGLFMRRHAYIVELKTLYGYTSGLFPLVADSRGATLAQVDVRSYFIKGGHKPVDAGLIQRIIKVLAEALRFSGANLDNSHNTFTMLDSSNNGSIASVGSANNFTCLSTDKGDCITGSAVVHGSLGHILGPPMPEMLPTCRSTVLYRFRKQILGEANEELHCATCSPFNARLRV